MSWNNSYVTFEFAGDDLGAAGDNGTTFTCFSPIQVVEVGIFVTTDLVPGAADVSVASWFVRTASVGVVGAAETTAPTTSATISGNITSQTTDETTRDGKLIHNQVDFTVAKGEQVIVTMTGTPTSGNGIPYMVYRLAGQSQAPVNTQRSGAAVE